MADGSYRYGQPLGHQFFFPHNQHQHQHQHQHPHLQGHPPRLLARNASPVKNGRPNLNIDTPSPTRSPGPQSPAHNVFGMYNPGHQQGQHPLMNGAPNGRGFGMHMNFAPKFQPQPLHHPHQQQPQPQPQQHGHNNHHPPQPPHQDHTGHAHGVIGHQHSFSSGGISNPTPHFTPGHLPDGSHAGAPPNLNKVSEHWQQQLQLAQDARQANSPHHHARTNAHENKGIAMPATDRGPGDENGPERSRVTRPTEVRRQDWRALDLGGQGLRFLSEALFSYTFLEKLYLCANKLTRLPPAIGRLKNLSHLDVSNNQIGEIPPEMGMLVNLKSLLAFDNNLHTLPHELGALYQLEVLGIEGNPLEESLKTEMMQHGTKALISHLREEAPVTLPPQQRQWHVLDDTLSTSSRQLDKFTVLTYNTLCDRYATTTQYGYVPSLALSWDYRKELILQEVRTHNADIVCLQEIDTDSYNEYFRVQLAYNDYKGVFWPKSRAKTMAEREAKAVDGCATLYKGQKYILLDKQVVEFANTAINRPDMKGEDDIYNRVMPRDQIAVITFLENRRTGSRIVVVNVHIYWDPAYEDVKLVQVAILMEQVSKLVDKYAKWPPCSDKTPITLSADGHGGSSANMDQDGSEAGTTSESPSSPPPVVKPAPSMEYSSGSQIPLIVCGDLNATRGSGVYDLLAHGSLPGSHRDLAGRTYGKFTRDGMTHPFSLKSSYGNVGELAFTNYTPNFTEVIDYIWYSTNSLQATGLLGEVDKEYLQRVPGFPNYHFPSDHLALLSEFVVKGKKEKRATGMEVDIGTGGTRNRDTERGMDDERDT